MAPSQSHRHKKSHFCSTKRLVAVLILWLFAFPIYFQWRQLPEVIVVNIPNDSLQAPFEQPHAYRQAGAGRSIVIKQTSQLGSRRTSLNATFSPLSPEHQQRVKKIKVLLTDYGWNSPDPAIVKDRFRSLRSRAMFEAIHRHPHFDAVLWRNITSRQIAPDPNTHYYVFLDLETCLEKNWPNYGRRIDGNTDLENGRSPTFRWTTPCNALEDAAKSILFTSSSTWAKMVMFDCGGSGPKNCLARRLPPASHGALPSSHGKSWYALVTISSNVQQVDASLDQGLPPPPILTTIPEQGLSMTTTTINPLNATTAPIHNLDQDLESICQKERSIFLFFAGNFRSTVRVALRQLHNPETSMITNPDYRAMRNGGFAHFFTQLQQAKFGAVPRGDNLFSYRFTEVLAAGAIPVVYADHWLLPFRPELVDWATCCAVIIPEADLNRTYDILSNISGEEQCRLRRNGHSVFHKYMKTTDGVIAGILEGLELVATKYYSISLAACQQC